MMSLQIFKRLSDAALYCIDTPLRVTFFVSVVYN